jgi:hypothetical protein
MIKQIIFISVLYELNLFFFSASNKLKLGFKSLYKTSAKSSSIQSFALNLFFDWLTSLFKTRGPFHRLCYVLFNGDVYLY